MLVEMLVLVFVGFAAGLLNTIAGAGSLLTLPALVWTGLDLSEANATNRVGVLTQSAAGAHGFKKSGVSARLEAWIAVPIVVGAGLGAWLATSVLDAAALKPLVFAAMAFVIWQSWSSPLRVSESKQRWQAVAALFFAGVYGGVIQIGAGFLFWAIGLRFLGRDALQATVLKVQGILVLAIAALPVFLLSGAVEPVRGLVLGAATAAGAYAGVRLAIRLPPKRVRLAVALAVVASVVALLLKD